MDVSGVMDVGFTNERLEFEAKKRAAEAEEKQTRKILESNTQREALPWRKKIAEGWSYDKYKSVLNSNGSILSFVEPTSQEMDQFIRQKADIEVY